MKLLVARHGQCDANAVGIMAGASDDSQLTEQGWRDAAELANTLHGFHGLFVSSPLHRTMQTAEYVRDQLTPGAPIRIDPDFMERDMGDASGKPQDEYYAMERSMVPIAGAETPEAMYQRISRGIETLRKSGEDTLLVAHNGTYRMIVCVLENLPPHAFATVPGLKNGEVKTFTL